MGSPPVLSQVNSFSAKYLYSSGNSLIRYLDISIISLTVDTFSVLLIPDELAKLVFSIPISLALAVIITANSSSVPAIPSANATHASLPDAIIIPLSKFSTLTSSPTIINIEE